MKRPRLIKKPLAIFSINIPQKLIEFFYVYSLYSSDFYLFHSLQKILNKINKC